MKATIRVNVSRLPDVGVKTRTIEHTGEQKAPFEFRSPHENDSEIKSQPDFEEVNAAKRKSGEEEP